MTPQTITITTARGETFTMNFDGPVSVEVKDVHLSPFEVGDMTPRPQSTAHEYKLSDLVLTQCKQVGKVVTIYSTNGITDAYGVEMPGGRKVKFLPWELRPHAPKFAIGDTVEWTDKRLGKKSGVVTDIFGHALQIGPHVTIWDHDARKVTPSTPPKFKVGDVVWWVRPNGEKIYARILKFCQGTFVFVEWLSDHPGKIRALECVDVDHLHHDYRTVAGGGWRKCEVGKIYKARDGGIYFFEPGLYASSGSSMTKGLDDLIKELP